MSLRKTILTASLRMAQKQQGLKDYFNITSEIIPDLSNNSSKEKKYNTYLSTKIRNQHASQIRFTEKIINSLEYPPSVLDIGGSSGNHLLYLSHLCNLRSISSCDIDPIAISRLKKRNIKCYHTRAEELFKKYNLSKNIYLSFEMVEHLHNPSEFFTQLSKNAGDFKYFIMSVPYRRVSTVGLKYIRRKNTTEKVDAGHVHIFELSPKDWKLLAYHSGLRMVFEEIYFQYPKKIPILSSYLSWLWKRVDFEGFYLAAFVKDTKYSDLYDGFNNGN